MRRLFPRRNRDDDETTTQQDADAWLDTMRPRSHPYDALPTPSRLSWRGGPPLDHETELAYRREQDDRD